MVNDRKIRSSREFRQLIMLVKVQYLQAGKNPPGTAKITKFIADKIDVEGLLREVVIRL